MEKIWGGVGENTHRLEKNAKMLEKINTIICQGPMTDTKGASSNASLPQSHCHSGHCHSLVSGLCHDQ